MMKTLTKTFALMFAATVTLSACEKETTEPPIPVVTIETQPTAPATLTEGAIPAATKLTVVATVTEGAELTYQWYGNTTATNTDGTKISGETAASYTLPATLTEGKYYYYCEVSATNAETKRTNPVTVTIVKTIIAVAPLTGVTSPVLNATPSTAINNGTGFTAALAWEGDPARFDYGTAYTAVITLTASTGFTFKGGYTNTAQIKGFSVNGIAPTGWVSNDGATLVFKVRFPNTEAKTLVTAASLKGVTSPVANATPSNTINNGTGFTAALAWDGNPVKFDYGTVYTAIITLTASTGFTFEGSYANTEQIKAFTVNGTAPAEWVSNNGAMLVFKVGFPATAARPVITIETQPVSPAPVLVGEIPAETALTVSAKVSGDGQLNYQWYSNTSASNSGGSVINGATGASYTLPATLTEGIYHYFCEVTATDAETKRTNPVTVTVTAIPPVNVDITAPDEGQIEGLGNWNWE